MKKINIEEEISNINKRGKEFQFPNISLILHTERNDFKIERPLHLDIKQDYFNNLLDVITIDCILPLGFYKEEILNYRDKLEISIVTAYPDNTVTHRYKFVIFSTDDKLSSTEYNSISNSDLDSSEMIVVKGQCIDLIMIPLKSATTEGIFRDVTVEKLTKGLIADMLSKIRVGGKPIKYKIIMDKPNNIREYEHLIINSNTKVINIPLTLQEGDYGIYNGGLNTYIIKDKENSYDIYIYPPYDYTRVDNVTSIPRLIIYNSGRARSDKNKKTYYKEEGSNDYKIVTSNLKILNRGSSELAVVGDTLLMSDPYQIAEDNGIDVSDEKITFNNSSTIASDSLILNESGFSSRIYTDSDDNLYKYRTDIIKATLNILQFQGFYLDNRIFIPGMRILFVFHKNERTVTLRGTLQSIDTSYNFTNKSAVTMVTFTTEKDN